MTESIDVLEALLFASDAPVEPALIQEVLELPSLDAARDLVEALRRRFEEQARVLQVIEAGGGFRMVTRPEVAPWLVKLARTKTKSRLSRPALETLAIIAYRQPVSRPEVDATRGVNSEGVLDNLLERRLIRIAGRKESPGRPFLYETTREFLVAFGLRDLGDLPKVEGELIVVDPAAGDAAVAGDARQSIDEGDGAERPRDQPDAADPMDTVADAVDTPAESTEDPGHAADTPTGGNGDRGNGGRVNTDDTAARAPGEAAQAIETPSTVSDDSTTDAAHTVDEREHVTAPKEDAGAASDSPQQDPGAGGTDITPGR